MQRKMAWPDLRGLALVVGTTAWLAGILDCEFAVERL